MSSIDSSFENFSIEEGGEGSHDVQRLESKYRALMIKYNQFNETNCSEISRKQKNQKWKFAIEKPHRLKYTLHNFEPGFFNKKGQHNK